VFYSSAHQFLKLSTPSTRSVFGVFLRLCRPTVPTVPKPARKMAPRPAKRRKTSAPQLNEVNELQLDNFESQLRESQPEDAIEAPADDSSEAAAATTGDDDTSDASGFDGDLEDDFDGINWQRLPLYYKPVASQTARKSWIYRHGYRVALLANPRQLFFVCRYCH
jgi:hypothetical protein